mmetsp:Transcript_30063/g.64029  ORF Transcript_30063/g.64029 Transcript_30063/m.64029 type:complete len:154 (-) Transcript_30063:124-585(-)
MSISTGPPRCVGLNTTREIQLWQERLAVERKSQQKGNWNQLPFEERGQPKKLWPPPNMSPIRLDCRPRLPSETEFRQTSPAFRQQLRAQQALTRPQSTPDLARQPYEPVPSRLRLGLETSPEVKDGKPQFGCLARLSMGTGDRDYKPRRSGRA